MIIAIPDEMRVAAVHHNGDRLEETGGEFVLPRFVGKVTVTGEDGIHHDLRLDPPLLFKLPQDWKGVGRKVRGMTKGHYIVMVPREQDWRTDDAPVEPAPCQDDNFIARFVYHEDETDPAPRGLDPDVSGLLVHSFTLEGVSVHDDSDQGVLYVGDPPELECDNGIVWALIGEEGRKGWTEPFQPDAQPLGEVLGGRQGRLFLRVYDKNRHLQDSAEFRYHRSLREIRVNGDPYTDATVIAPSATGHRMATIEFVTTDDRLLRPRVDSEEGEFSIVGNKVVVPPVPDPDRFSFTLASDGGETPCVIVLPRIWWRLEAGGQDPADWSDRPLRMTRDEFGDHADAEAVLLLRLPRPVTSLRVRFDDGHRNVYQGHGSNKRTEVPLAEFAEYTQIEERLEQDALLTAQWEDRLLTLIRIAADSEPPDVRRYELMTIHRPELTAGQYRGKVSELTAFLAGLGATDQETDCWGKRRLAYEIDHVREGYYTVIEFTAMPDIVDSLRQYLSLIEEVMRYKIIRREDISRGG